MTSSYVTSAKFTVSDPDFNLVVSMTFINNFTVAAGNPSGRIIYVQLGMACVPAELPIAPKTRGKPAI